MNTLSPELLLGYCTNVHAGTTVDSILRNLQTHAVAVRKALGGKPLGIGLWFSENAVREALEDASLQRLMHELNAMELVPYTLNGFPQGDFHSAVVKHRVYEPTWWDASRLEYTLNLVRLLDRLLEPGCSGSISTLPIAWGSPAPSRTQWEHAAHQLLAVAFELHRLYETTGRMIVIAMEPEPGCALTDTASLRRFFGDYLSAPRLTSEDAALVRRYLTICHDVCHAAVMCEDQEGELQASHDAGLRVGKVQVSSAIRVRWDELEDPERAQARTQIGQFAEDRYLHQTMVRLADGSKRLHEDLPQLLQCDGEDRGEWRIHFHVPIYLQRWGMIESTRDEIVRFLTLHQEHPEWFPEPPHWEVETYAWGVLPTGMQVASLSEGIAKELDWLRSTIAACAHAHALHRKSPGKRGT